MSNLYLQDPNAKFDYTVDWTEWLEGDTITASTFTPDTGITVESPTFTTTKTFIRISGGTAGKEYSVVNHITTAEGQQADQTIVIIVEQR